MLASYTKSVVSQLPVEPSVGEFADMNPWEVIEDVLAHKKRSLSWLAQQFSKKTTIQVVMNWEERGVPPKRFREIADILGITIDQLEGLEPLPWSKEFEWPFSAQLHERIQQLRPEEVLALESKIWDALHERAPAVVESQLRKAVANVESHSLLGNSVTGVTPEQKGKRT